MTERRPRGRPRTFEPEQALAAALEAFRRRGFSGTSMSDLSLATGLNRPSLYAAFGNKESLFEAAVDHYWARVAGQCLPALHGDQDLATDLAAFFARFLDLFADEEPGGCIIACGLPAEVDRWPSLRDKLHSMFNAADQAVAARLEAARQAGELSNAARPERLARLIVSSMLGWSLRSRAGSTRGDLEGQAAELTDGLIQKGKRD